MSAKVNAATNAPWNGNSGIPPAELEEVEDVVAAVLVDEEV